MALVNSMGMGNPCGLAPMVIVGVGVGDIVANPLATHTHDMGCGKF
jgi:hypothetical protein